METREQKASVACASLDLLVVLIVFYIPSHNILTSLSLCFRIVGNRCFVGTTKSGRQVAVPMYGSCLLLSNIFYSFSSHNTPTLSLFYACFFLRPA